jgi:3',5'-cyclic AMP phosphodiesterase CpdA
MLWLEKQLQRAKRKLKEVIIVTHHPLFPENGFEALNNREILSLIEKYPNVRAVLSGHHYEGCFGT